MAIAFKLLLWSFLLDKLGCAFFFLKLSAFR
jgi:hypothetical protein